MCLLGSWSMKRKQIPGSPRSLMLAGQEGPCGHSPSVQARMPHVCHPFSPLTTEKAWMLCSQIITVSISQGLGAFPQPQAAPLTCDLQPIMLPHSMRLRNARTQPLWADMQRIFDD